MKTTNFITAFALAAAILFSACNKTESGDTDVNEVEVTNYTYDELTNTYTVYTATGLLAWNTAAQIDTTLNCTLAAEIDMTGIEWTPVGNEPNYYTGTFEGSSYTITGLTVTQDSTDYVGLIGGLGSDGVVQNLTLDNVNITGKTRVGGVVGINNGIVTSCSVSGSVTGNGDTSVGGVVGHNGGTVTDCSASCNVSGADAFRVGGVVGWNYGTVTACTSSGNVSGYSYIGGVVGENRSTVTACYHTSGSVSSSSIYAGGVVGWNANGTVTSCYHASGSVSGNNAVGGVVGYNASTVTACYWSDHDNGIGGGSTTSGTTEVDGTDVSWDNAVDGMNQGIETWNSNNSDKYCYWKYVSTGDLPTLTKSE